MRQSRTVVLALLGAAGLILFPPSTIDCAADTPPKALPAWFEELDTNKNGEISLKEWLQGGKKLEEFCEFDLNDDGLITAEEVLRVLGNGSHLKLRKDRVDYKGEIGPPSTEKYRSKKAFKIFTIALEEGKTYQFEMVSPVYFAYLYLEGPDGPILGRADSGGNNQIARIVHRAAKSGTYRVVATSQGGFRPGAFTLSVRVLPGGDGGGGGGGGAVVKGLPPWFRELDKDEDGQVSLREWEQGGKKRKDFLEYDLNDDGFITREEALRTTRIRSQLKLAEGRGTHDGHLEQTNDEKFREIKFMKILTVELKAGATYQFDLTSKTFKPLFVLQDPNEQFAAFGNSQGKDRSVRIVHQAAKSGTYRVLVTSQGGPKNPPGSGPGAFSLSVRALGGLSGTLPKGLPPWFEALDKDANGEISLKEWLQGGKKLEEFREFDLNDDGLITMEEVLQVEAKTSLLKLVKGRASHKGTFAAGSEVNYHGKKLGKIFTVKLEAGKTYQIDHISVVTRAFDAYLYLEGPNGTILAQDDDGGGDLNSRIVHKAAVTGNYRIIATSLSGHAMGAFAVSVRQLGGPGGGKR
jgi:Ca2+-binding EF-hand superfamily protein